MIRVACAIIFHENKILATQRGPQMRMPFKWEFPGGKVEPGETPEQCIEREIFEELRIQIEISGSLESVIYEYPDISIELIPFTAKMTAGSITLREHMTYQWLNIPELNSLDWAEADLKIVEQLIQFRS